MPEKSTVERVIDRVVSSGETILSLLASLLAAFLILYGGYVLYDTFYTSDQASGSAWDLIDYRPDVIDDASAQLDADTLAAINADYRAWLTVYDTGIDYPVMQGTDDLYYASHDIYKESSLSGAIYLAASNTPDLSDNYNVIYGHHMDNGAMFGDLDNFLESAYFGQHKDAILVAPDAIYDLTIFAVLETDAYDSMVYNASNRDLAELLNYLKENSTLYDEGAASGAQKVVAMSTCLDAATDGRLVVFAKMTKRSTDPDVTVTPTPTPTEVPDKNPPDKNPPDKNPPGKDEHGGYCPKDPGTPGSSGGSGSQGGSSGSASTPTDTGSPITSFVNVFKPSGILHGDSAWALVNLICLIVTLYLLIPVLHLKDKFGRGKKMKELNEIKEGLREGPVSEVSDMLDRARIIKTALADKEAGALPGEVTEEEFNEAVAKVYYSQKGFSRRFRLGIILELIVCAAALIAFVLTEDMSLPMILIDKWTPLMLILLLICWLLDIFLVRYRKDVPAEEEEEVPQTEPVQ